MAEVREVAEEAKAEVWVEEVVLEVAKKIVFMWTLLMDAQEPIAHMDTHLDLNGLASISSSHNHTHQPK